MKDFIFVVVLIVLCITALCFLWKVERWINYKWSYNIPVQTQIDKAMQDHIKQYHQEELNDKP